MPEPDETESQTPPRNRSLECHVSSGGGAKVARGSVAAPHRSSAKSRHLPPISPPLAAALRLVLSVGALLIAVSCSSQGTTAQVEGLRYDVSVARSLQVVEADLTPYGEVSGYTDSGALPFAGTAAYALDGVDPTAALVVRWADGVRDDRGSLGEYALLYRDRPHAIPGLCAYFDPASESRPPECG